VSQFRRRFPACEVVTFDVTGSDYHETLRSGAIDVLLGRFAGPPRAVTGELHNPLYPSHTPKGRPIAHSGVAADLPMAPR
jgi:hypothetical protein